MNEWEKYFIGNVQETKVWFCWQMVYKQASEKHNIFWDFDIQIDYRLNLQKEKKNLSKCGFCCSSGAKWKWLTNTCISWQWYW